MNNIYKTEVLSWFFYRFLFKIITTFLIKHEHFSKLFVDSNEYVNIVMAVAYSLQL